MRESRLDGPEMGGARSHRRAGVALAVFGAVGALFAARGGDPASTEDVAPGAPPVIRLLATPPRGGVGVVRGRVDGLGAPDRFAIACLVAVDGGWWTKPRLDAPLTRVGAEGTWTCDIETGGRDAQGTHVACFLVPCGFAPPLARGLAELPAELYAAARAHAVFARPSPAGGERDRSGAPAAAGAPGRPWPLGVGPGSRRLRFAGRDWWVKSARRGAPLDPGPNLFTDDARDVFVDAEGALHLRIVRAGEAWLCAEVVLEDSLGYGTYEFEVAGRRADLDEQAVIGFFTWDDGAPQVANREIDIEHSRWGDPSAAAPNAQYVVQPWQPEGHREQYRLDERAHVVHRFRWTAGRVVFTTRPAARGARDLAGVCAAPATLHEWSFEGREVPVPARERVHINVWLLGGRPPGNGCALEVVVRGFEYTP